MLCLEEIDVIILKHLLNDGRKSFTSIARECNTSTDVISKHFDKLTRSGVIVGATIQKNYPLFGYKGLALLLVNTVSQNLQETIKGLGAITAIRPPFRFYNCPYNVGIISIQSDSKDLSLFKEKLKKQIQIIESKLYFWVDVRNIPENLSFGCSHPYKLPVDAKNIRACAHYASDEKPKLDEIDMKIIDELNGAGRASFSEIANRIGSSTDTVNRRYNKLIQNGIIKVSIQVNPILLGYKAQALFLINFVHQNDLEKAIDTISSIPDISFVVKISGDYDLLVCALLINFEEAFKINEELLKLPNIGRIESGIMKTFTSWPLSSQHLSTF